MHGLSARGTLLAVVTTLGFTPALAGDENVLVVRQESSIGATSSNQLLVNQSGATNSLIIGPGDNLKLNPDLTNLDSQRTTDHVTLTNNPAIQKGDNNSASITITGTGGEIQLIQDGTVTTSGPIVGTPNDVGNDATIVATGDNTLGAVLQFGDRNIAELELVSDGAQGLISQNGLNNTARLTVGSQGTGQIVQNGNENETILDIPTQNNAIVTQNGNGLTVGQTAFQVFSTNPGTVTITQTGF